MDEQPLLRCTGQPVRRYDNQPTGVRCFAVYPGAVESARVIGWRVGEPGPDGVRPAMCPTCGRPGAGDEGETSWRGALEPLPGM